jgi:RNA polymerase sigma-70 factor (ECF subfamily)
MIFEGKRVKKPSRGHWRESFNKEALVHMNSLYSAALYMTRDGAEAEDLVQDTLLRAYRFWDRFESGTNCKAWLFRIQTNTFINRRRKKTRTFSLIEEADSRNASSDLAEKSSFYGGPEVQYLENLMPEHIKTALNELPESFRLPIVLADLQDFSYKEVAEIIDCPVGTVMSRLFRGRKKLQAALFAYAVELGVISERTATADDGTLSLETYRARKKASGDPS